MMPGTYFNFLKAYGLLNLLKIYYCNLKALTFYKMFLELLLKLIPYNFACNFKITAKFKSYSLIFTSKKLLKIISVI